MAIVAWALILESLRLCLADVNQVYRHHFELLNSLFYPPFVLPQGKYGSDDAKENIVFQNFYGLYDASGHKGSHAIPMLWVPPYLYMEFFSEELC